MIKLHIVSTHRQPGEQVESILRGGALHQQIIIAWLRGRAPVGKERERNPNNAWFSRVNLRVVIAVKPNLVAQAVRTVETKVNGQIVATIRVGRIGRHFSQRFIAPKGHQPGLDITPDQ